MTQTDFVQVKLKLIWASTSNHLYMSSLGENLTALGMSMRDKDRETFARHSLAECLLSGNTTVVEIGMVDGLGAERAVKIIGELGIRACEGPEITDGAWERTQGANIQTRWLDPEVGLKKLEEAEAFAREYAGALDGRLIPALYPDKVDTCSEGLQRAVREKADELKTPISIHAGQWVVEFQNMLRMYRRTPVEFLHDTGLLGPDLIIGHGWAIAGHPLVAYPPVDGGDLQLLAESGATVSHDPVVFAKRGNRMHSHTRYLRAGVNVSIGADTTHPGHAERDALRLVRLQASRLGLPLRFLQGDLRQRNPRGRERDRPERPRATSSRGPSRHSRSEGVHDEHGPHPRPHKEPGQLRLEERLRDRDRERGGRRRGRQAPHRGRGEAGRGRPEGCGGDLE